MIVYLASPNTQQQAEHACDPTRHLLSFIQSSTRAWTPDMDDEQGSRVAVPIDEREMAVQWRQERG